MNPAVAPLAAMLDLNTDLLLNCLDGLSEAEAQHRLQGGGNSLAFLIAHLTDTRHFLATRLHVGQAAFLRRQIGKPAMAYTRGSGSAAGAA